MRSGRRKKSGFTLIEVLLVSVILSVVALAVYKAFSDGITLWKKVNADVPEEDLGIFFSDMAERMAGVFTHGTVPFEGGRDRVSFPAIVAFGPDDEGGITVGQMTYFFDGSENWICREERDYSQVYREVRGAERRMVKRVASLRFLYYCRDSENGGFVWVREWTKDEVPAGIDVKKDLPVAIKAEVVFREGDEEKKFTRTVAIPLGG